MKQPPSSTREESETDDPEPRSLPARAVGAVLVLSGLLHVLAPAALLRLARRGYRTVLNVEFDPLPGASRRVQAIGVGLIAAGAHLLYYGGVLPSDD